MPAETSNRGLMKAMSRLFGAWRQRRARRRIPSNSFMSLSDRALADIGVRRADVYGAMIGVAPLRQSGLDHVPEAAIHELPRRPRLTIVANDLDAAA